MGVSSLWRHRAVARLADQFLKGRCQTGRDLRDDVPLGGGRQRDGQGLLQACDAMERQAAAVLEQRDHGRGARVVLRLAHPCRGVGGKHRPAQAATQALQLIDLRLQGRDPGDPHQDRGLLALQIHSPVAARLGAGVAVLEGGVGDGGTRGPGIVLCPVAAVALARLRAWCLAIGWRNVRALGAGARLGRPCRRRLLFAQDASGGFGSRIRRRCAAPARVRFSSIRAPRSPAPGCPPPP